MYIILTKEGYEMKTINKIFIESVPVLILTLGLSFTRLLIITVFYS